MKTWTIIGYDAAGERLRFTIYANTLAGAFREASRNLVGQPYIRTVTVTYAGTTHDG